MVHMYMKWDGKGSSSMPTTVVRKGSEGRRMGKKKKKKKKRLVKLNQVVREEEIPHATLFTALQWGTC